MLTLLRSTESTFSFAELIACPHQNLTEPPPLPWREDDDAGKIVIVPAQLFFTEKANYLLLPALGISVYEEIVEKGGDIVEDGFGLEKELGKKGEVLSVQLCKTVSPKRKIKNVERL